MKKKTPKKEKSPKVEYVYIEPKNEVEREKQEKNLDKAFDILFDATIGKKTEFEVAKGKTQETFWTYSAQDKRKQMRWFVNKLISLCDSPYSVNPEFDYDENLYFEVESLRDSGLFPFGIRGSDQIHIAVNKDDYTSFTQGMLWEIRRNIYKLKDMGFNLNADRFRWRNLEGASCEDKEYHLRAGDFLIDTYFRPLFEAYLVFMDNNEKEARTVERAPIEKIEILEDKKEQGRIYVYINGDYDDPRDFSRGKRWSKLYELASGKDILFDKDVFDYFNYHPANPLYTEKGGFKVTSVLKEEDGYLVPNIEIILTTQNKITRQLKTLKKR